MQIRTRVKDGIATTEVVDQSDGTVVKTQVVADGEQFVVTCTTADSPADLEYGEIEAIPSPEQEAAAAEEAAGQTTAAVDKPLYKVLAGDVPDGFTASGLETPDGAVLYCYDGDVEGEPHTFDVGKGETVALYADADDGEQPVQTAETPEGQEAAAEPDPPEAPAPGEAAADAQTGGAAEGAEAPADGQTPAGESEEPTA